MALDLPFGTEVKFRGGSDAEVKNPMPDEPTNGGTFRIQSKQSGKQLALPEEEDYHLWPGGTSGVFTEHHIVPRDQGAVWTIEFYEGYDFYRFTTPGVFPWFETTNLGRLDSNRERQVYAHEPNNDPFQMWKPVRPGADDWMFINRATGLALDGNDRDIYTTRPNYTDYQRWRLFAASPPE